MISEYGQGCMYLFYLLGGKVDFDGLRALTGTRKRLRDVVEWRE